MQPMPSTYPVTFEVRPADEVARWRPLVQWILAFPHFLVASALGTVANICAVICWFAGVFTGRIPPGLTNFIAMSVRYQQRVTVYAAFLTTEYPAFSFEPSLADPGDDAGVRFEVAPPPEERNRVTIFFRYFMIIPHAIVLAFVGIAMYVVMVLAFFAVVFTGSWPTGMQRFVIGFLRWAARVSAYGYLLTDEYPPFSLG